MIRWTARVGLSPLTGGTPESAATPSAFELRQPYQGLLFWTWCRHIAISFASITYWSGGVAFDMTTDTGCKPTHSVDSPRVCLRDGAHSDQLQRTKRLWK